MGARSDIAFNSIGVFLPVTAPSHWRHRVKFPFPFSMALHYVDAYTVVNRKRHQPPFVQKIVFGRYLRLVRCSATAESVVITRF